MKISRYRFVISAAQTTQLPQGDWPEVAFAGRSNVGKSSLINSLVGDRHLAKVSRQPGRTRQINFFAVNECFHLVDLPGYGFASAPKEVKRTWRSLMLAYLCDRPQLAACVLLLDIRREPNDEDLGLLELLGESGKPCVIALTKADKLPLQQRQRQAAALAASLGLLPGDVIATSAVDGRGRSELWATIENLLFPPETLTSP